MLQPWVIYAIISHSYEIGLINGGRELPQRFKMEKTCGDRIIENLNNAIDRNLNSRLRSFNDARKEKLDTELAELERQRDYYAAREAYLKEQVK